MTNEWTSVKDRLPKPGRYVLVTLADTFTGKSDHLSFAALMKSDDGYYWLDRQYGWLEREEYSDGNGGTSYHKVVAWMRVPPLYGYESP